MRKDMAREYEKMRRFNRSTRSAEFTRPDDGIYLSDYGVRAVHTTKGAGEKSIVCGTLRSTWRAPSHYDKGTAKNRVANMLSESLRGKSGGVAARERNRPEIDAFSRRAYTRGQDGTTDVSIQAIPITSTEIYYENDIKSEYKDRTMRSGWHGHRSPVQTDIVKYKTDRPEPQMQKQADVAIETAHADSFFGRSRNGSGGSVDPAGGRGLFGGKDARDNVDGDEVFRRGDEDRVEENVTKYFGSVDDVEENMKGTIQGDVR